MTLTQPNAPATREVFPNSERSLAFRLKAGLSKCASLFRSNHIAANKVIEPLFWDRNAAYVIALAAVRQCEWALAERELTNGNGDLALSDARCLNLLGVVYEATGRWTLAHRCYSRAIRSDKRFEAPQVNIRRHYELNTFGRTDLIVRFGDEGGVAQ
jgi:hypothetical protein